MNYPTIKDVREKKQDDTVLRILTHLRMKMAEKITGHIEIHLNEGKFCKLKTVIHENLKV